MNEKELAEIEAQYSEEVDISALVAEVRRLNGIIEQSEVFRDIDRSLSSENIDLEAENERLTNLVEALAFVTEDETGMLSDAELTAEKLEEILHTLKGQRDYAAETAEMHAKEVERLRKLINRSVETKEAIFKHTAFCENCEKEKWCEIGDSLRQDHISARMELEGGAQ